MTKYLTKSRFKQALECPTKLYYNSKPKEYANSKIDDPFLEALAKGGFQVGELAKCYYPDGHDIQELDYETSLAKTNELMKQENVVIFEAAVVYKNLFIRVDVLEKIGNTISLIEVKSKSCDPNKFESELWNSRALKKGEHSLKSTWKSYIYDLAFQGYVSKNAFPNFKINHYLMCADKTINATVDGLNQKFMLVEENGRSKAVINGDVSAKALGNQILTKLDCNEVISVIHNEEEMSERFEGLGFEGAIWKFANAYNNDEKIVSEVGSHCKSCEFRSSEDGKMSGFNECWKLAHGMNEEELQKPFVFDVWNFRGSQKAIDEGKHLLEELEQSDFTVNAKEDGTLSNGERQWLQVKKEKENDHNSYLDLNGLESEMGTFKYPLHMIDFETCMVAIPFNKGKRPYEQIAFQFSHHKINSDGTIEHASEYINATPGFHPNFEFLRELKKSLSNDDGTIFRYSNHENTVLCQIREQLLNSEEKDKDELINFIETITTKKDGKKILWQGERSMVDLCEMVKKYYYSPFTNGSNSIKYVLPAILNESDYIKEKYAKPIYGSEIKSKNFESHQWINIKDGLVENPYNSLPPVFDKYDYETLELVMSDSDIANGGAALTAYAMMQFTHMSDDEREKVKNALLRYCELDTFAMVMIWEYWNNLVKEKYEEDAA
jgi:hypothetical protein